MVNYYGMSQEIREFEEQTGEETLWTNSMFGGMPAYLIYMINHGNIFKHLHRVLNLNYAKPANYVFLSLIGFFIALIIFGVNPWLCIAGAIAYAFSTYFFIIIEVGHSTKAIALGYMPPIIAGIYIAYNRKLLLGAVITGIFLTLQIFVNHLQITYYTLLLVLIYLIFRFITSVQEKKLIEYIRTSCVLAFVALLAVGCNFTSIYLTYDYGKDSMRGKSELTFNEEVKTSGLDKDYAMAWSYDIDETLTLLIPNFKGGASGGPLGKNSAMYDLLSRNMGAAQAKDAIKQMPLYWGTQPFTEGPVYVGAIVFFLFILGLFLVEGRVKWWLLTATVFSILLAWGHNFRFLSELFLDYFPGYNKFRTVSMILVIAEFTMPLLAILALKKIIEEGVSRERFLSILKWVFGIVGGITLIFALFPGMFFDFTSDKDAGYFEQYGEVFMNAIIRDRQSLFSNDAFRSLAFIILISGVLLAYLYKKINKNLAYVLVVALILVDMWPVNKRYLNNDHFVSKRVEKTPFTPTQADNMILQDKDPDFRVFNLTARLDQDSRTSYFHKSLGGYHGAKMKRYQEMIDFHIGKRNMSVINMLNTKYFIIPTKEQGPVAQRNPGALGNAWFVEEYRIVANADSEITAMNDFKPGNEAIVDKRFENHLKGFSFKKDTLADIKLLDYKPNHLVYESNTSSEQLAVFSEVYYNDNKGWKAYVDGKQMPHFRVNYILRAMRVPAGKHKIEFRFEPKMYSVGNTISLASSVILLLLLGCAVYMEVKKNKSSEENTDSN